MHTLKLLTIVKAVLSITLAQSEAALEENEANVASGNDQNLTKVNANDGNCYDKKLESWGYTPREYEIDVAAEVLSISLEEEDSIKKDKSLCVKDLTFGYKDKFGFRSSVLWVNSGCRGSFRVCTARKETMADKKDEQITPIDNKLKDQEKIIKELKEKFEKQGDQGKMIQELKETLENQVQTITLLQESNSKMKACESPLVAFTALLPPSASVIPIEGSATVKFTDVALNMNNDYDSKTGVFTTSEPGVYKFTVHTLTHTSSTYRYDLVLNGSVVRQNVVSKSGSIGAVLHLKKGDTVEYKNHTKHRTYMKQEADKKGNFFDGVLLSSDKCHS